MIEPLPRCTFPKDQIEKHRRLTYTTAPSSGATAFTLLKFPLAPTSGVSLTMGLAWVPSEPLGFVGVKWDD